MDKIEKIRKYIEERLVYYPTIYTQAGRELIDLRNFLDTLSGQPDNSLEEEFSRIWDKELSGECDTEAAFKVAHYFAEWQKSQMLKDAVEVTVQSPLLGPPMVCCIASGCSDGDKVRIVILKAEEE